MKLDKSTIDSFIRTVNSKKEDSKPAFLYGTAVVNEDGEYVQLDGSNFLTPVSKSMDFKHGDRVIVEIKEHDAVVTGNLTSPANVSVGDHYLRMTSEGLRVGELTNGTYCLLGTDSSSGNRSAFIIRDKNDNTLATFSDNLIDLGVSHDTVINLFNKNGYIAFEDLSEYIGEDWSNVLSICNNKTSDLSDYKPIVLVEASSVDYNDDGKRSYDALNPTANLQLLGGSNPVSMLSVRHIRSGTSITLTPHAIDLSDRSYTSGFSANPVPLRYCDKDIITDFNLKSKLDFTSKTITVGTETITPNSYKTITHSFTTTEIPSGYKVVGVLSIDTNHHNMCQLTSFAVSNSSISVSIHNSSTATDYSTTVTASIMIARI